MIMMCAIFISQYFLISHFHFTRSHFCKILVVILCINHNTHSREKFTTNHILLNFLAVGKKLELDMYSIISHISIRVSIVPIVPKPTTDISTNDVP